jgi:hypothetical protein
MTKPHRISHEFVEFIPEQLVQGVLYISIPYATAQHLCLCGCGHTVVTPLSPRDWRVTFDGETVSLWPSIGNWSFDCQSHYWIERNRICWSRGFTPAKIAEVRARDRAAKESAAASGDDEGTRALHEAQSRNGSSQVRGLRHLLRGRKRRRA